MQLSFLSLNTLFVDKNLRYHGLIQAYSHTNRIYDATKRFENIVTFRDLEQATIDAITVFGNKNTKMLYLKKAIKSIWKALEMLINAVNLGSSYLSMWSSDRSLSS